MTDILKGRLLELAQTSYKQNRYTFSQFLAPVELIALDELARELMKDEKDHLAILGKIGEIRGLLLDIFT